MNSVLTVKFSCPGVIFLLRRRSIRSNSKKLGFRLNFDYPNRAEDKPEYEHK